MSANVNPLRVLEVSRIAINDCYGSGDPHFNISATKSGKRLLKEQLNTGDLVKGKLFTGEEVILLVTGFIDGSIKNDPTKALWKAKAIQMSLASATFYQQQRYVESQEKLAKSAYSTVKGQGFIESNQPEAGVPVETASETSGSSADIF